MTFKNLIKIICTFLIVVNAFVGFSNKPASQLFVDLQKLSSLKRVLYIAAHPDDENTRALAYFSLGEKAETAYLSLTRGDGGQNLIGDELSEDLGVLRTQELLAARSYDGANQYFTRAVDFGYSKSAKESLDLWGKEALLSDVVLIIRQFRPDVIITRFPPDKRGGHGHHTASAMLAIEAFEKAADPNYLPAQVAEFGVWKTTAVYWNASNWWNKDIAEQAKDNPNYIVTDIGGYDPLLGMSYNEIGTLARSQHKCQGFGAELERGTRIEYFEYLAGEKLSNSFFEKNMRTWQSILSGNLDQKFADLLTNFDFKHPEKNVPALFKIRTDLEKIFPSSFREEKMKRCDQLIMDCLGLYGEVVAKDYAFVKGEKVELALNLVNRSGVDITLKSIGKAVLNKKIAANEISTTTIEYEADAPYTSPYWLNEAFTTLFQVKDKKNLGRAENTPTLSEQIEISVFGSDFKMDIPVTYKWGDPSYGERRRAFISAPNFSVNFEEKSLISVGGQEKTIRLKIHSFKAEVQDEIKIQASNEWVVTPKRIPVNIKNKHEDIWVEFKIKANANATSGPLNLTNSKGEQLFSLTEISYDHIPTQVIFKAATLNCIKLNAQIKEGKIAYIKGVDDAVPEAIKQLGFEIDLFEVSDLATLNLSNYQSVVLGIRIYNVYPALHNFDDKLFKYVEAGGNLVMQYNTASRSASQEKFGPIPFELSRNRVTEEDAAVTFLAPNHPIMNVPNKITQADFKGWVQERGLYFANNWDPNYTPLFAWNDAGEDPQKGALIVAKYGKGQFVYTGISFFRELPNGVEGAFRLFANILSY